VGGDITAEILEEKKGSCGLERYPTDIMTFIGLACKGSGNTDTVHYGRHA
jgi:hypothetical protein